MSRLRDLWHDNVTWNARKTGVRLSNGLYRLTRPYRTLTGAVRNRRNRRFLETGKGFVLERATRGVRSSLPLYRNRINRATGRPRRDDREVYGRRDAVVARARQSGATSHGPLTPAQRADRVLGAGRAARAGEALRQANHDPWAETRGRSR